MLGLTSASTIPPHCRPHFRLIVWYQAKVGKLSALLAGAKAEKSMLSEEAKLWETKEKVLAVESEAKYQAKSEALLCDFHGQLSGLEAKYQGMALRYVVVKGRELWGVLLQGSAVATAGSAVKRGFITLLFGGHFL
jgi:hypothetical protein